MRQLDISPVTLTSAVWHLICTRTRVVQCIGQNVCIEHTSVTQLETQSRNNINGHEVCERFVKPNNVRLLNGCGYRTKGSPWYDVTRGSGALEYRAKINSGHNVHLSQVITGWWLKFCYKVQPALHVQLPTAGARTITA